MSESVGLKELLRRKIDQTKHPETQGFNLPPNGFKPNCFGWKENGVNPYGVTCAEGCSFDRDCPDRAHLSSTPEAAEYTGGSVSYYKISIAVPLSGNAPYVAECNDIIEALGMNYAEGNAFKAIWRMCAARTLGVKKRGYTDGLYDAEKVEFFGARMVAQQSRLAGK